MNQDDDSFEQEFAKASAALREQSADAGAAPAGQPAEQHAQQAEGAQAPAAAVQPPAEAQPPQRSEPAQAAPAPPDAGQAPQDKQPTMAELLARVSDLERRERASAARASTVARENNRLVQELSRLRSSAQPASAPAQAQPQDAAPAADVLSQAPELEAAVRARVQTVLAPILKKVDEASAVIEPLQQRFVNEEIAQTHARLDEAMPGWRDTVVASDFTQWVDSQPKWVQDLYERSTGFEDSATVLGRYYASTGRQPNVAPVQQTQQTNPKAGGAQAAVDPNTLLRAAAGIASRPSSPNGSATRAMSEDELFEAEFAAASRQLRSQQAAMR